MPLEQLFSTALPLSNTEWKEAPAEPISDEQDLFLGQIVRVPGDLACWYGAAAGRPPAEFHHRDFESSRVLKRLNVG